MLLYNTDPTLSSSWCVSVVRMLLLLTIVQLSAIVSVCNAGGAILATKLTQRFNWKILDYAYPDERTREHAIRSGTFVPENNLPVGIEVWKDKLFITVPRWRSGIPATLNYITLSSFTDSPKLNPYPDWSFNREGNCQGLTTTYRVKVDACDRLWVLDSGTVGIGNTTEQVCPVALHVFDLKTDKQIRRYQYKPTDTNANTFIANIAVDIGATCDDTFVYASDELGYGLIVYSYEQNDSWRVTHPFFMPDPLAGDYNIAGLNFQWGEEGIFGMSLSPVKSDGFRTLFFHPLSSHREFAISTSVLRNRERATSEESYHDYQVLAQRSDLSHSTAEAQTEDGIMFYALVDHNAIGCWNSRHQYQPQFQGIVDRDDIGLVFPSDVKIDQQNNLWIFSDRMPVFLISQLDYTDINFRVYSIPVPDAIRGTVCDYQIGQGLTRTPTVPYRYTPVIRPEASLGYQLIPKPTYQPVTQVQTLSVPARTQNYVLASPVSQNVQFQRTVPKQTSLPAVLYADPQDNVLQYKREAISTQKKLPYIAPQPGHTPRVTQSRRALIL